MTYILLALSILFAALNNIFLHKYNDKKERCNIFAFNALLSALWIIILLIVGLGFDEASADTIWYGILYGSTIAFFLLFKMLSLGSGPVSITALIGCCSLVVPTLGGLIIWKETINALQIAGLVLLLGAMYLCIDPKSNMKIKKKWIVFCIFFFLAAGANGVTMKIYNKKGDLSQINEMMIIASMTASVIFSLICVINGLIRKSCFKSFVYLKLNKSILAHSALYITLCGVVSCGYQRLNLYLTGALPSIVFFPIFNGAVIFLSCLSGYILFKEKLSIKQFIGLIIGTISIMLIGNAFSFLL